MRARAARRSARDVLGYATTADAAHMASRPRTREGAQRCMRLALADADLTPARRRLPERARDQHARPAIRAEARAIRAVFGAARRSRSRSPPPSR